MISLDNDLITTLETNGNAVFRMWEPKNTIVVLGRSNIPSKEMKLENADLDRIRVLRRLGGGGTVVLSKGMLVLSVSKYVEKQFNSQIYFEGFNSLIIKSLNTFGIKGLAIKGISDICIYNRKIVGSSIYIKNKACFYQASLLVSADIDIISKYLKHPSREPDYRMKRKHEDFITTIKKEGYEISINDIKESLRETLNVDLCTIN